MDEITQKLFSLKDEKFGDFNARLIPSVPREKIIGVRTPQLRKLATWVCKNAPYERFLDELPHYYFEENNLHGFIIEHIKDYGECLNRVNAFLPHVDNWATCDQMNPKAIYSDKLLPQIRKWLNSSHTYSVRFGIACLMRGYLGNKFDPEYLRWVADIKSDEYYIRMMAAWFFATAAINNYELIYDYLKKNELDDFTHNMTIKKAAESFRISENRKAQLKLLKK